MILHALKKSDWETCKHNETYGRDSLEKFGFIHCSDVKDVVDVANSHLVGIGDLVLLWIDPSKVHAPIKWEDLDHYGVEFPHIYGELNLDAISAVLDFPTNGAGTFVLPHSLEKYITPIEHYD